MTQGDFFGGGRKKPPAKYTDAQQLTSHYKAVYTRRFGETPDILAQDGKTLKDLATRYGADKVRAMLDLYLASDDRFYADNGYSISLFRRRWNALVQQGLRDRPQGVAGCRHQPRCQTASQHTKLHLAEMRGTHGGASSSEGKTK